MSDLTDRNEGPLIRYWDRNFNEITREEAEAAIALDVTAVAITFQPSDEGAEQ